MTNNRATTIKTATIIEAKRGKWILSSILTSGNKTAASINATIKGRITAEVIFKTAPAKIQHRKTIKKKEARPE
jgi:hypothetical protein